ncbi:hypothetical protein AMTR_s00114p00077110 [Amborella trichopoda]|uniref:Uncharacterized protein n=1 Tax=Amborella trichopoda TaxID=13333 RepID=W1NUA5_AMBTC|nr:hypothetical protein AMTR_s00114p00077110 [Amborella trichopoda]
MTSRTGQLPNGYLFSNQFNISIVWILHLNKAPSSIRFDPGSCHKGPRLGPRKLGSLPKRSATVNQFESQLSSLHAHEGPLTAPDHQTSSNLDELGREPVKKVPPTASQIRQTLK